MSAGEWGARRIHERHVHSGVTHMSRRWLNLMLHQNRLTGVRLILASSRKSREQDQRKNRSECGNPAHYAVAPIVTSLGFHSHVQVAVWGSPSGGNMW